jgi:hypothetical protein
MPLDLELAVGSGGKRGREFVLTFGDSRNAVNTTKLTADIDHRREYVIECTSIYKAYVAKRTGVRNSSNVRPVQNSPAGNSYATNLAYNTVSSDNISHDTKEIRQSMTGLVRNIRDTLNSRLKFLDEAQKPEESKQEINAIRPVLRHVDDLKRQCLFYTNLSSAWCYYFILSKAPVETDGRPDPLTH